MSVEETLRTLLLADSTVASLVVDRVHASVMPQPRTVPAVVITVLNRQPVNSLNGAAAQRLFNAQVQVDSYATTYRKAQELAGAVDAVLADLSGPALSAYGESMEDLYENETQLHRVTADYTVTL